MEQLIRDAQKKNPDAFEQLIQGQMHMMYKIAKSILNSDEDAADAIQDTILACWEKLDSLKQERYFKTWLTRILVNKCNDQIRRRKNCIPMEKIMEKPAENHELLNLEWNETLSHLDKKYRLVLMLYYVEGFKTSEISKILEIPESTVRTRLARGREKLTLLCRADEKGRMLS